MGRDRFGSAGVQRFARRREDAERAIEVAFAALELNPATPDQLGDLADAIDALKQRQFYVSVLLAHGAMHSKPLESKRPQALSRTLDEMKQEFRALRGSAQA